MKILRATQRSSDPTTTADPKRDPIPQIRRGDPWDLPPKRSRPYRRSSIYRRTDILLMDVRMLRGPFASVGIYVMTSIRNLCLYSINNLCVKPHMYSLTKRIFLVHAIKSIYATIFKTAYFQYKQ